MAKIKPYEEYKDSKNPFLNQVPKDGPNPGFIHWLNINQLLIIKMKNCYLYF